LLCDLSVRLSLFFTCCCQARAPFLEVIFGLVFFPLHLIGTQILGPLFFFPVWFPPPSTFPQLNSCSFHRPPCSAPRDPAVFSVIFLKHLANNTFPVPFLLCALFPIWLSGLPDFPPSPTRYILIHPFGFSSSDSCPNFLSLPVMMIAPLVTPYFLVQLLPPVLSQSSPFPRDLLPLDVPSFC